MQVTLPERDRIGAEIRGVDVTKIAPSELEEAKRLLYRHKLLVFRDQSPSDVEYIEFARKIGKPQIYFQAHYHHPDHPEIFVSSNEVRDGKKFGVAGTGRYWHTDYSFMDEPLPLTMLFPKRLPQGIRATSYVDMERVARLLPADLRRVVQGRRAIHEGKMRYKIQEWDIDRALIDIIRQIEKEVPAVTHPALIRHPVTEAEILYMNEGFTTGIEGVTYEETQKVLGEIFAFTSREDNVHTHAWREGDLLIWDNRSLIHMASTTTKGEVSTSYRIGIYDEHPFYVGIAPPKKVG